MKLDSNARTDTRGLIKPVLSSMLSMLLLFGSALALGQTYPAKTVSLVVPAAPGGATGSIGFILSERLSEKWGHRAIIENKPGGNHQIGASQVAKSRPDGYTLLLTAEAAIVINQFLYKKLSYDPVKDFLPVSGVVSSSQALIVSPSLKARTVRELIDLARANPGGINYGTTGPGSTPHLGVALLGKLAGVQFTPVHYNGAGPAIRDVMGGHTQMMVISLGVSVPPSRTGQVRMLAVGAPSRLAILPDVPTVAQDGVPGYEATTWFGLFAPAGTPYDIVSKVNADVQGILTDPVVREKQLTPLFFNAITGNPAQFAQFIAAELTKWQRVVADANVTVD